MDMWRMIKTVTLFTLFGSCLLSLTIGYELQLTDGSGGWQGQVQVRMSSQQQWGPVCDRGFGEQEAAVVCRQLNYSYSRVEEQVYRPDYQGVFVLDGVSCHGNEDNIENCDHSSWGTHTCDRNHYAAGVCCSNSPSFGETKGDVFISHCGTSWMKAEEACEDMGATIAIPNDYHARSSELQPTQITVEGKSFWTRSFFTPWMWSDGCVTIAEKTKVEYTVTIDNNAPELCLQHCMMHSDSFLLSESLCACINSSNVKTSLTTVMPSHCKITCKGDRYRFCGTGSGAYWNIYTTTTDDTFFRINDPGIHATSQCAVLVHNNVGSKNLASEPCEDNNGYICHRYNAAGDASMMFFTDKNSLVGIQTARLSCPSKDGNLQLVGKTILQTDKFYFDYNNLWVDLSRVITNFIPDLNTATLKKLNPKWCYSITLTGSNAITDCNKRFLYTCIKDQKKVTTKKPGFNDEDSDVNQSEILHLVSIISAAVVVAAVIIIILICWIKRSRGKNTALCCFGGRTTTEQDEFTATYHGDNSDDTKYEDIKETSGENVYSEIGEPLLDPMGYEVPVSARNSEVNPGGLKEPVIMTRSYSHPKDLLLFNNESELNISEHPNYIYPYDKVYRAEDDDSIMDNLREKTINEKKELIGLDTQDQTKFPVVHEENCHDRPTERQKHQGNNINGDKNLEVFGNHDVKNAQLHNEGNTTDSEKRVNSPNDLNSTDDVVLRKHGNSDLVTDIFLNENDISRDRNSAS